MKSRKTSGFCSAFLTSTVCSLKTGTLALLNMNINLFYIVMFLDLKLFTLMYYVMFPAQFLMLKL